MKRKQRVGSTTTDTTQAPTRHMFSIGGLVPTQASGGKREDHWNQETHRDGAHDGQPKNQQHHNGQQRPHNLFDGVAPRVARSILAQRLLRDGVAQHLGLVIRVVVVKKSTPNSTVVRHLPGCKRIAPTQTGRFKRHRKIIHRVAIRQPFALKRLKALPVLVVGLAHLKQERVCHVVAQDQVFHRATTQTTGTISRETIGDVPEKPKVARVRRLVHDPQQG